MSKFDLGYLKPKGTIWHTLDRVHIPQSNPNPVRLEMLPATRANEAFTNGMFKLKRETNAPEIDSAAGLDASDDRQCRLFAKAVIVGWDEVKNEAGEPLPFSAADAIDLLTHIAIEQRRPDIVHGAFAKAYNPDNFRDGPVGTAEDLGKR